MVSRDPLLTFPAEIVLRIIDFLPLSALASLHCLSTAWHDLIDINEEAIYSSASKTEQPVNTGRDLSFLSAKQSFANFFGNVSGWKDLSKRQTLLKKNWKRRNPWTLETILQIGDPVWRFRPDFKRRFVVSTAQLGGVKVTDMDHGILLWELSRDNVRPYAHLEYEDGTAVWDRVGNAVEVWKADEAHRGIFHRTAVLHHNCETRGFQLSYQTLCVVSTEGQAFVYDMTTDPPTLRKRLDIEPGAIGHLYQSEDAVLYSLGTKGYHVHSKDTGAILGSIQPQSCNNFYYIDHPVGQARSFVDGTRALSRGGFLPQRPRKDRLVPLRLERGRRELLEGRISLEDDEWGAGMMSGNYMVGISRGGRFFICSDWRGALSSKERAQTTSAIIETEENGSSFDLGGWLSIKHGRVLFEVIDQVYIFTLSPDRLLPGLGREEQPIHAIEMTSNPHICAPVSFMEMFDDCLAMTYTTMGQAPRPSDQTPDNNDMIARLRPTKAIRIISLAPEVDAGGQEVLDATDGHFCPTSPPSTASRSQLLPRPNPMLVYSNDD